MTDYLAIGLYAAGFGLAYALIPGNFPISMAGRFNWKRWTFAAAWPIAGAILLGICLATMFA
jgi:hypothetical protein